MTRVERQSRKAWLFALALMTVFASLAVMSLPAQADLTCTNLHESKVSYDRECGGLQNLEAKFSRYIERLNNEHGNKSNAPQDVVDKYNQAKQSMEQRRRSCKSARDSYEIFQQMAREQGLKEADCSFESVSGKYIVDVLLSGSSTIYPEILELQQSGKKITGGSLELLNGGSLWTIYRGSVVNDQIEFDAYYGKPNGLNARFIGTISSDRSMRGTWFDIAPGVRSGSWRTKSKMP